MTYENKEYNILVVSNEKRIVNKLSILFENSKYHFELVRDALSAINNINSKNYDLIMINFDFPKDLLELFIKKIRYFDAFAYIMLIFDNSNNLDALDIIKNYYNNNSQVEFLVISADYKEDVINDGLEVAGYIKKPFKDYEIIYNELKRIKKI